MFVGPPLRREVAADYNLEREVDKTCGESKVEKKCGMAEVKKKLTEIENLKSSGKDLSAEQMAKVTRPARSLAGSLEGSLAGARVLGEMQQMVRAHQLRIAVRSTCKK